VRTVAIPPFQPDGRAATVPPLQAFEVPMSFIARLVLGAVLVLSAALPADAVQPTGSAAWTNDGWTNVESSLYNGPGQKYGEIGTVGGGLRIRVARCSGIWCEINAKNLHGWMIIGNISFGQYPWHPFDGRQRFPVRYGGGVCFYTGQNFTGAEVCYNGGHVVKDLLLSGLDNSFSSVKIDGGSVMACRDRNFRSYCLVINKTEASLDGLLDNGISSIHVY
jgi:hypothetical protein